MNFKKLNSKQIGLIIVSVIAFLVLISSASNLIEGVDAGEIVVIQDPIDGDLHVYKTAGLVWQSWGTVTKYTKEEQYWFSSDENEGSRDDAAINIRFNDGGSAKISGSVRWQMPTNDDNIVKLHSVFGSQAAIEHALMKQVVTKSVYLSGPLLSSRESFSEKRPDLIRFIEDQITLGIYKTETYDIETVDPISGSTKHVTKVRPVIDSTTMLIKRQDRSPLEIHGITIYNLTLNKMIYEDEVLKQIQDQRKAIMDVQTSIANVKKAEQDAIFAEQNGIKEAATAKWKQEVLKAEAITKAEQQRDVAKLSMEAAEFYKKEQILKGEGEGAYKRLVMQADGALEQKLAAYIKVSEYYANAMSSYKGAWVPTTVMGNSQGGNGATNFMEIMTAKAAKDLSLNLGIK